MIEGIITAILLLLHILTCAALYYGYKYQRLNLKKVYMPFVILIPFWGVLCVLLLNVKAITDSGKKKEIGIEKMRVNEEIYKNIFSGITQERKEVVPLEEALIINSPSQRRKLIMDVLYDNPEEYIDLLYEARMNDDVEVVHYATTAMSELSKEYDLKIQKMEHDYAKNSNDEAILSDYCELLEKYISSGLMQGQPLILQRNQYEQLLEKKRNFGSMTFDDFVNMAENELELKDYGKAEETLCMLEKTWPEQEETWLLKLKYYTLQNEGEKIQKLISEMKRKHIYISKKGQEVFEFWNEEGEMADESEKFKI